jgi:PAS domain S-box-containing protein
VQQHSTPASEFAPEQLSEDILDGIGEAFIALGRDWRILYFNRAAERFYGQSREAALGRSYWELYPGTVGSEFERQYRRALAEQVAVEFQTESTARPGRWLDVRAFPTRQGLGVGFRDITERRQSDEELRYQLALTRAITDNSAEALFLMDEHGRVSFMNPAAERMFGFAPDEMLGRVLHDLVHHHHPDGRPFPMSECPLSAVFRAGTPLQLHEDVFFRKDGTAIAVACSNTPILGEGRVAGAVLVVRDVTERQRRKRPCGRARPGSGTWPTRPRR